MVFYLVINAAQLMLKDQRNTDKKNIVLLKQITDLLKQITTCLCYRVYLSFKFIKDYKSNLVIRFLKFPTFLDKRDDDF